MDERLASHQPLSRRPTVGLVWNSKLGGARKPATDLNKTFQAFLKTVPYRGRERTGLLNDYGAAEASIPSGTISHPVESGGVSYEDLRRTMGTGKSTTGETL